MSFAEKTVVPVDRSKSEIERLLTRYGATSFASGWDSGRAVITFRAHDRVLRFVLPLPSPSDRRFVDARGDKNAARSRYEQELRRLWRALLLVIKGKLEAVESKIVSFEQEFLPYVVLPDGRTVADAVAPAVAESYRTGAVRALLPEVTG